MAEFVQDPFWASWGTNLANSIRGSGKNALDATHTAEQIVALRREQERKRIEFEALQKAGQSASDSIAAIPVPMSTRDISFQPVGPVNPNDPDVASLERAPNHPNYPDRGGQTLLPSYQVQEQYVDPKVKAQYDRLRPALQSSAVATAYKSPHQIPGYLAQSEFGLGGVPASRADQQRLIALGKGAPSEAKPDNYVAKTPDGKTVAVLGSSFDGVHAPDGRRLTDIAPKGTVITRAGEVGMNEQPKSIFDSTATMLAAVTNATNAIVAGKTPDPANTRELSMAVRQLHPTINKVMNDAVGNTILLREFIEKEAPPELKPLLNHIANTLPEYQQQAAPPAAAAAGQPTATAPPPAQPPGVMAPGAVPKTDILVAAPASQQQINLAAAVTRADSSRRGMEDMIGVDPQTGQLPAKPWLPDWKAAWVQERSGNTVAANAIINKMDPKAREYYAHAKSWIEPVLRLASGAAIRTEEYHDYMAMFIPNAGDSNALIAQKLTRVREWQAAVAGNVTANQAAATMIEKAQLRGDKEAVAAAERLRVRAREAGTADIPRDQLPPPKPTAAPTTPTGAIQPAPANPGFTNRVKNFLRPPQESGVP